MTNGASADVVDVLICDDNQAMRALLGAVVESSLEFRVAGEAGNGDEAVAQAKLLRPGVVLLDLAMPVRSGLEAIAELRAALPEARIVVFSGFAETIARGDLIALGADDYLEKGADFAGILASLRSTPRQVVAE